MIVSAVGVGVGVGDGVGVAVALGETDGDGDGECAGVCERSVIPELEMIVRRRKETRRNINSPRR
jgi:hypothetical protein